MELKVYSGYRGHRNFTTPATLRLRIARGHCARPRLYWYKIKVNMYNLLYTHAPTAGRFQSGVANV